MNTDGSGYAVLKSFTGGTDGAYVSGSLVLAGSTLYGTAGGGGSSGHGVVFRVNTVGSGFAVVRSFTGSDGGYPFGGLLLAGTTLYGATTYGGSQGNGVLFKLNTDGSGYTVLNSSAGGSDGELSVWWPASGGQLAVWDDMERRQFGRWRRLQFEERRRAGHSSGPARPDRCGRG